MMYIGDGEIYNVMVFVLKNELFMISGWKHNFPVCSEDNGISWQRQGQVLMTILMMMMVVMLKMIMYPCSTKTREVLGNPSPTSKRFPETREISRGRGKSQGRRGWISQYLPRFGGARTFSHHQSSYREWIRKSFPVHRKGLTVLK